MTSTVDEVLRDAAARLRATGDPDQAEIARLVEVYLSLPRRQRTVLVAYGALLADGTTPDQ